MEGSTITWFAPTIKCINLLNELAPKMDDGKYLRILHQLMDDKL
jgi:hypothetical protein